MVNIKIKQLKTGPVTKILNNTSIVIWGEFKKIKNKYPIFVVRILKSEIVQLKYIIVSKDTMIGRIVIENLPNIKYYYQTTCIYLENPFDDEINNAIKQENIWDKSSLHKLDLSNDNYSLIFGSCRRYISIAGAPLFGTGKQGDKIYKTINKLKPKLFLSIGDQVYYDPVGNLFRTKSKSGMIKLNRKVRSFSGVKDVLSNTISAEICDDHDIHKNNTNSIIQYNDINTYNKAKEVYYNYQHYSGNKKDPLWYSFNKVLEHYTISFFIMDTRTERFDFSSSNKQIISRTQMDSIKKWLLKEENSVKFIVSSCPILSQKENDSWYGYPEQQKELLNMLSMEKNIFILTGDAHCARVGVYDVSNLVSDLDPSINQFTITEILSSGLVAVNHDRGKEYNGVDKEDYDEDNDFPLIIDNTSNKGVYIKTVSASSTYPQQPKTQPFANRIRNIFTRIVDNVFTRMCFFESNIKIEIINQDGLLLQTVELSLN